MEESELQEYMTTKLRVLAGLFSNVIIALIMVSMVVILNFAQARDIFYYALILFPIIGRYYIGDLIMKWLSKQFKEFFIY